MLFLVLLTPKTAYSVDVTFAWSANTETDLAGYRIYHREEGQAYDYNYSLWEGTETTCTIYNIDDYGTHCFVVRAFDMSGNESTDSEEVCYQPLVNTAPTADAGADQTVEEGVTVTLNGSNSTDPDGTIASYLWTQTAGTSVTLSDSTFTQPSFTAPYVGLTGEALTFELTVQDDGGLADTDTVIINVSNVNQAPTADAGADQTVEEGMTVTLDGSNSWDADGAVVSYSWTQVDGLAVTLSETWTAQPTFTAPDVSADEASLTFQLTVTDDGGLQSADTCVVDVLNVGSACPAVYVSSIAIELKQKGPHYQARAHVVVLDESDIVIREATVRGDWTLNGTSLGASVGSTNGNGEAKLDSDKVKARSGDTFTLIVTEITKDGCSYDTSGTTRSVAVP
jgi:hypothetical protein